MSSSVCVHGEFLAMNSLSVVLLIDVLTASVFLGAISSVSFSVCFAASFFLGTVSCCFVFFFVHGELRHGNSLFVVFFLFLFHGELLSMNSHFVVLPLWFSRRVSS